MLQPAVLPVKLSYLVSLLSIITNQTMQTTKETAVSIGQALRRASQGSVLVTSMLIYAVRKNIFRIKFVKMPGDFWLSEILLTNSLFLSVPPLVPFGVMPMLTHNSNSITIPPWTWSYYLRSNTPDIILSLWGNWKLDFESKVLPSWTHLTWVLFG